MVEKSAGAGAIGFKMVMIVTETLRVTQLKQEKKDQEDNSNFLSMMWFQASQTYHPKKRFNIF